MPSDWRKQWMSGGGYYGSSSGGSAQQQQRRTVVGKLGGASSSSSSTSSSLSSSLATKGNLLTWLTRSLILVVILYLLILWNFHTTSSLSSSSTPSTHRQQQDAYHVGGSGGSGPRDSIGSPIQSKANTCDFRRYPPHRYYGLPSHIIPKKDSPSTTTIPDFLNHVEYIYGERPQLIRPTSTTHTTKTTRTTKLCVDQSEWLPSSSTTREATTTTTTLPFADGTNPSILQVKDNDRIHDNIRTTLMNVVGEGSQQQDAMYLTTICMTNSQCAWKDTPEQQHDYRLSTDTEPSTVRTLLLILDANFQTLAQTTIVTEIDAPFGRRIRGPKTKHNDRYEKDIRHFALDDARLFTYRGDIWISYREGKGFGYDKQVLNKLHLQQQQPQLQDTTTTLSSLSSSSFTATLKASETQTLCCGRNMALIDNVETQQLQALTWVDPVTVVDVEMTTTTIQSSQAHGRRLVQAEQHDNNNNNKKKKKKSHFHGTNGFMVYLPQSHEYLGIGHFHRPEGRDANDYARFGHHYTHAFFTISGSPPFHLKRLSPELLLPSHDHEDDAEIIQFWSGLDLHSSIDDGSAPPTLALAYGINDCEGAATYLDLATVESLLRNVPQGLEVVDLMKLPLP